MDILPLVDVVKKEWKKDTVITFLQRKDLNLDLDDEDIGIIRSKKVSGKDFLGLTAEKLENYGLQPGPASRIAELVKEIKDEQEQSVAAGTRSLDRVYFFVDNSNVTIEGGFFIRSKEPLGRFLSSNNKIIFDYGLLFKKIRGDRELGGNPIIVGSEISPSDSIHKQGYDVKVFKRNCKGKEKGVDNFITLKMTTTFCDEKRPGTLILIAGDGDYFETLLEAVNRKWKVEVWFWSGIFNYFYNHEPTRLCEKHLFPIIVSDDLKLSFPILGASEKIKYEAKIHYTQLETCYKFFIYINGNPYDEMESLEITSCTMIENREIMEWLAKLNLLSWINRENNSIFLYFNNKVELKTAKEWIMKEHKELVVWEKTVQRRKRFYKRI